MPKPSMVLLGVVALDDAKLIASIGDWRIIYEINKDEVAVIVLKIAPGGEVYVPMTVQVIKQNKKSE
jgi:hypothetical protein